MRKIIESSDRENVYDDFYEIQINNKTVDIKTDIEIGIRFYVLIEWIFDWKSESNGYGFPFDRTRLDLALRIKIAVEILEKIKMPKNLFTREMEAIQKIYKKLKKLLFKVTEDEILVKAIEKIEREIKIFDRLRDAMRITDKNSKEGLNDEGDNDINAIEKAVKKFVKELQKDSVFCKTKKGKKFLKQINKYWDKLFADPILIEMENGAKILVPQRTNNIMEQIFRELTRANKRKTGDASITRTIKGIVADTPLIRNLKNEKYLKMILGDKKTIEEVFAEIDVEIIRGKLKEHKIYNEKKPAKIKKI